LGVLSWIIIGLLAGWFATRLLGGSGGILHHLAIGLVGGVIGGILFTKLSPAAMPTFVGSLISATVGAVILLLVWRAIRRS
jgi:uncharacterized membrane protein YeaQ/YmgE (transglycosylase-associated protein family)